jgi:hypothetical protein
MNLNLGKKSVPQGLKHDQFSAPCGTAKAEPFQGGFEEDILWTSS